MIHLRLLISIALLTGSLVKAQTPTPKSPADKKNAPATTKEDPDLQQRRSVAFSALQALAIEARSYREEPLRARVQARIADALWDQDQEAARALFRRAWEVAETLDTTASNATPALPGRMPVGRTPPRHHGMVVSLYTAALDTGAVLGLPLCGGIAHVAGYRAMFASLALLAVVGLALVRLDARAERVRLS